MVINRSKQEDSRNALWVILSHKTKTGEIEIERRLAPSPEDAPRIAVLLLCSRNKLEHGDILRVLWSAPWNKK